MTTGTEQRQEIETSKPVGIELHETMTGGFALGENDPDRGGAEGRLRGTTMSLHCAIRIAELDRFYRDAEHPAELAATVDYPPFGDRIQARAGTFHLFKPSESHGLKLMVYRFGFDHRGDAYFFEGKKYLRDGSPLRKLWDDTTRLYATLYRGHDSEGEIAGAGVLDIGLRGMMDLARSMRVTNAETTKQRAWTLAGFGRFFFGGLWQSYRGHTGDIARAA